MLHLQRFFSMEQQKNAATDEDPAEDEVNAGEDERSDWEHQADDEELEDNDGDLLKEVFVATLIIREVVPVLVAEQIAIHAIAVIGVAALRNIRLEVLLVLLVELFLDLLIVGEVLRTFATRPEANEQALERDGASSEHDIRVEFRQLNRDIVHRRHLLILNLL